MPMTSSIEHKIIYVDITHILNYTKYIGSKEKIYARIYSMFYFVFHILKEENILLHFFSSTETYCV